jgi:hypothetical protein
MTQEPRNVDGLRPGPILHRELPGSLVTRIDSLRSALDDVYSQSMAVWLDGFQRDVAPEREVLWWEDLARSYLEYSRHQGLDAEQKQAAFRVIIKLALGSAAEEVSADLANLPAVAVNDILGTMRKP